MNSRKLNNKIQDLKKLLRPEVKAISSYSGEEDNFKVEIDLSSNESPFSLPKKISSEFKTEFDQQQLNRYPEIYSESLHQTLALYLSHELKQKVNKKQLIAANGSDEILDMLVRTFVEPGDIVLSQAPSFSMYKYFTELNGGEYRQLQLNKEFNFQNFKTKIDSLEPKLIFLCSPNNPTGEIIDRDLILKLADYFKGPVLVDEAYADFSEYDLRIDVKDYPNLVVTRTFSKAFGLAGIRFGYLYGNQLLVEELKKVLKPYNLNSLTELLVRLTLAHDEIIKEKIEFIKREREKLYQQLKKYKDWNVYPSEANFIYFEGEKTLDFKRILNKDGIKVRSYNRQLPALRITIGSKAENTAVLKSFTEFKEQN